LLKRNIAVKALIYRIDGKILLQIWIFKDNINCLVTWNFFGGYVEDNENLLLALERELKKK